MVLGERHTHHGSYSMLAKCIQIVCKVLPLIVKTIVAMSLNLVLCGVGECIDVIWLLIVVVVALRDAVTQTRCIGEALERLDVGSNGTTYIDTLVVRAHAVALCQWVTSSILYIVRCTIEIIIMVSISHHRGAILISVINIGWQLSRVAYVARCQWIYRNNRVQHRTITFVHTLGLPLLERGVCRDVQPLIYIVVCINLTCKTLVNILISLDDTIVIEDIQVGKETTLTIASLDGKAVLMSQTIFKSLIIPVGVLSIISLCLQLIIRQVAQVLMV